jgi:hypothetical protein
MPEEKHRFAVGTRGLGAGMTRVDPCHALRRANSSQSKHAADSGVRKQTETTISLGRRASASTLEGRSACLMVSKSMPPVMPLLTYALNASIARLRSPLFVAQVCENVASVVQAYAEMGHLPVTLDGDHSLAMGTIPGTLR